jgi:hypothetical protein
MPRDSQRSLTTAMANVSIHEVRQLVFSIETVVDAVLELDRSHGGALSISELVEVHVDGGEVPGLRLQVTRGSGASATSVETHYTPTAIAAAVMSYCFRARIPLPRQGTKRIDMVPDGFQLTITSTVEVLRLHGELPVVSETAAGVAAPEVAEPITVSGDAALDDPTNATSAAASAISEQDPPVPAAHQPS